MSLIRISLLVFLGWLLIACSGNEIIHKPAPLVRLENPVKMSRIWNVGIGIPDNRHLQRIQPWVYKDRIYTVDIRGEINISNLNGEKIRTKHIPYNTTSIVANDDIMVITTIDGDVLAYNTRDFSLKWKYPLEAEVLNKALLLEDKVIVRSLEGKISALSIFDGSLQWSYQQITPVLSNRGYADLVYYDHRIIAAFDNGILATINPIDGKAFWEKLFSKTEGQTELERINDIDSQLWVEKGYIYLIGFDGYLSKVNLLTAQSVWKEKVNAWSGVVANKALLFISDKDSNIIALSKETGIEVWRQKALQYRKTTIPVVYKDKLLVADDLGYLHLLSADSGKILGRVFMDDYGMNTPPVIANQELILQQSLGSYLNAVRIRE